MAIAVDWDVNHQFKQTNKNLSDCRAYEANFECHDILMLGGNSHKMEATYVPT